MLNPKERPNERPDARGTAQPFVGAIPENIPDVMKEAVRWIGFKLHWETDAKTGLPHLKKTPYNVRTGRRASSNKPATWATFGEALKAVNAGAYNVLGFASGDGFCFDDLDKYRDPATGVIHPDARAIIDELNSYTEVSPSGTGLHIWTRGTPLAANCRTPKEHDDDPSLEMYSKTQFATITGDALADVTRDVCERTAERAALHARVFAKKTAKTATPEAKPAPDTQDARDPAGALDDGAVIARAMRAKNGADFARLYFQGDTSGHGNDASRADLALIGYLRFYACDEAQLDRLFRRSALMRDKWDERHASDGATYGAMTIAKALAESDGSHWTPDYRSAPRRLAVVGKDEREQERHEQGQGQNQTQGQEQRQEQEATSATRDDSAVLEIIITNDGKPLRELSAAALNALYRINEPPRFFTRDVNLARIRWNADGSPAIETLALDQLRYVLERTAQFTAWKTDRKTDEKWLTPIAPPLDVVHDILAAPAWKLPPLAAVTRIPVMRPDGSILTQPGYDKGSQLYYSPDHLTLPAIPEHPTAQEVQTARELLDDALDEFPYDSAASKANMYGLLLTLVVRPTIRGCVPLALLDAPRAGSGKSLLTTVLGIIATGAPVAFENMPDNDEELRKKITTALQDGDTLICYDNVDQPLKSGVLASALTALVWKDRVLGANRNIIVPQRATWIATGNNLVTARDIRRRCYRVRLDSGEEHPEDRDGFRHPDLQGYVMEHRGELLAALLTIARAWYDAGRPGAHIAPIFGSYQEWADTLSGILAYAQVDGFLANRQAELEAEDDEGHEWAAFLAAWDATFGDMPVAAARLIKELISEGALMRDALPTKFLTALHRNDGELTHYLGNALRRQVNIPRGPEKLRIVRCGVGHGGAMTWAVQRPKTGDTGARFSPVSPPVSPVTNPEPMRADAPRGDTGDTGDTHITPAGMYGRASAHAHVRAHDTPETSSPVSPVSPVSPRTPETLTSCGLEHGDTGGDTGEMREHVSPGKSEGAALPRRKFEITSDGTARVVEPGKGSAE